MSSTESPLVGRKSLVKRMVEVLQRSNPADPAHVLVHGSSGIGKSAVVDAVSSSIPATTITLKHEIRNAAETQEQLIADLARQLVAQANLTGRTQSLRERLDAAATAHGWKLATAILADLAERVVPNTKETAAAVIETIRGLDEGTSLTSLAETLTAADRDNQLAGLFLLMEKVLSEGVHGVLIIDGVEKASDGLRDTVLALIQQLTPQWSLVLSINDEVPRGVEARRVLWPPLEYQGAVEVQVRPLVDEDLREWCQASGRPVPPPDQLARLVEKTEGRPLFLRDWVAGLVSEADLNHVLPRVYSYYENRIAALSESARQLLFVMSIFSLRSDFEFSLCLALSGQTALATHNLLTELTSHLLLRKHGPTWRFAHDVVRSHVESQLPPELRAELAGLVLERRPDAMQPLEHLRAKALTSGGALVAQEALEVGERLLNEGAYSAALEAYRLRRREAQSASDKVDAGICAATTLLESGYYEEGLREVGDIDAANLEGQVKAKLALCRAQLLVRLNRYPEALQLLASAREMFPIESMGTLETEKQHNIILRDQGRHDEAIAHAQALLGRALEVGAGPAVLASSYRTLARALAKGGRLEEAVDAAGEALRLARTLGSIRAEANALLAAAEAYRHGWRLDQANDSYRQAQQLAERIGNVDCFLWAGLGLADSLLLTGDHQSSKQALERIGRIVEVAPERYPLEHLHWTLSRSVLEIVEGVTGVEELQGVLRHYDDMGIAWPTAYANVLQPGQTPTITKLL